MHAITCPPPHHASSHRWQRRPHRQEQCYCESSSHHGYIYSILMSPGPWNCVARCWVLARVTKLRTTARAPRTHPGSQRKPESSPCPTQVHIYNFKMVSTIITLLLLFPIIKITYSICFPTKEDHIFFE